MSRRRAVAGGTVKWLRVGLCAGLAALWLCACSEDEPASGTTGSAAITPPSSTPPAPPPRVAELLAAELARRVSDMREEDLASRDVAVRRAAARALARARRDEARPLLLRALHDEDPEVVTWAAYGLGDHCAKQREGNVGALVVAAARWSRPPPPATAAPSSSAFSQATPVPPSRASSAAPSTSSAPDAPAPQPDSSTLALKPLLPTILRAIGRCRATRSEAVLLRWANARGPEMYAAIDALGDIARHHKTLREDTVVALLSLATGDAAHPPIAAALYPLGRSERLPASTVERAAAVAQKRVEDGDSARPYAARTLGLCGEEAVPRLEAIVKAPGRYDAATRAEAVRGLVRSGERGQRALGEAVKALEPPVGPAAATSLVSADFGVLLLAIRSLTRLREAREALTRMAAFPAPPDAPAAVKLRLTWLRCAAAQLLVERNYTDKKLRSCDVDVPDGAPDPLPSSIAARAVVAAIGVDGTKIRGKRLAAWQAYAEGGDVRARQAALALLGSHDEVRIAPQVLAKALGADAPGVVAAAAEVLAKHPQRAFRRKGRDGDVVDGTLSAALLTALSAKEGELDLEATMAVIDASAALSLGKSLPLIRQHCRSPYRSVVEHAEKALAKLTGAGSRCPPERDPLPIPQELQALATAPVSFAFTTPVGELTMTLDPTIAPIAVTRARQLVEAGYYDNMLVHRVVPGFVSQFGSPTGDGYGGAPGRPPMPCETSPLRYERWRVGVALAGRDTGSSQLFVTHAAYPHLDGGYALLGSATGAWDALIDGDRIQKARLLEPHGQP